MIDHRSDYGHLTILWAARHPSLLVFTDEYDEWNDAPDTELHLTVDNPDQQWDRNVGLITQLLEKVAPSPMNAVTITCGPPIMIHFVSQMLEQMRFRPGAELRHARSAHALWTGQVRSLQSGRKAGLCGWAGVHDAGSWQALREFPLVILIPPS